MGLQARDLVRAQAVTECSTRLDPQVQLGVWGCYSPPAGKDPCARLRPDCARPREGLAEITWCLGLDLEAHVGGVCTKPLGSEDLSSKRLGTIAWCFALDAPRKRALVSPRPLRHSVPFSLLLRSNLWGNAVVLELLQETRELIVNLHQGHVSSPLTHIIVEGGLWRLLNLGLMKRSCCRSFPSHDPCMSPIM